MPESREDIWRRLGITPERWDPSWWSGGSRPPDKVIWDQWTAAERAESGYPDWESYRTAARARNERISANQAARNLAVGRNLSRGMTPQEAMNAAGIFDERGGGRAYYRNLMTQLAGLWSGGYLMDPSSGTKTEMFTSDLNKRGRPAPMTDADWAQYNRAQEMGSRSWEAMLPVTEGGTTIEGIRRRYEAGGPSGQGTWDPSTQTFTTQRGRTLSWNDILRAHGVPVAGGGDAAAPAAGGTTTQTATPFGTGGGTYGALPPFAMPSGGAQTAPFAMPSGGQTGTTPGYSTPLTGDYSDAWRRLTEGYGFGAENAPQVMGTSGGGFIWGANLPNFARPIMNRTTRAPRYSEPTWYNPFRGGPDPSGQLPTTPPSHMPWNQGTGGGPEGGGPRVRPLPV